MDIEGLGTALVEQLVDSELVHDVGDLYNLKLDELADLERMAEKSPKMSSTHSKTANNSPFTAYSSALGIRHIGATVARTLSDNFHNIDRLRERSPKKSKPYTK